MEKYADKLKDLLATEPTFTIEEKINKNHVASLARQYDKKLLELLSSNEELDKLFFVDINGSKVFKKDTFLAFINNKEFLPDSYTAFKSKIGLGTDANNYLSEDSRVVLNWPYKDCVLEGGQDKEDQKRDEVFFNEILAPDQINTILDDKVFTNWKRYDKDGEHDLDELKPDDNLIIRGNNLVVLHSLKKRFAGKIKLIYIDPPYNTGNDGFNYNDSFNHSTWLTFMKNRLTIAKELLSNDGTIFVSCDDHEQAYLKVLMDEVFGIENFISTVTVVTDARTRSYDALSKTHEFLLIYSKSKEYQLHQSVNPDKQFQYTDSEGGFDLYELRNRNAQFNDKNRPNLFYPFYLNPNKCDENGLYEVSLENKTGFIEVLPQKSGDIQTVWRQSKETVSQKLNTVIFGKKSKNGYQIVKKYRENTSPTSSVWTDKDVLSDRGTLEIKTLFGEKCFAFPKPEGLIAKIISLASLPGDIVLDYHLGSGTTAAVAHKMGRQYIGIEQMDYIDDIASKRLEKVIQGDDSGISKSINWTGGGSFVYCNIKNDANTFRERVQHADEKDLEGLLDQVLKSSFLSYRVDPKKVSKKEFEKLSLADKKHALIELVDNNTLYLNYSEINDNTYNISEADKRHNKVFYGD